jgi:nucleotide-binding universal stress UspA family protein
MKGFIKNILWPTDFSTEGQEALFYADIFAKAFSASITALHVTPDFGPGLYEQYPMIQREIGRRAETLIKKAQGRLKSAGEKSGVAFKKIIVTGGSAGKKIIETAEKEKAGLIVMGKKGQSALERILIGSAANHVLRHSPVPVLVTKKRRQKSDIKKILVPTDFTKEEDVERDFAWNMAKVFGASITLLYVLELYGHEFRMVDQMFKTVLEDFKGRKEKVGKGIAVDKDVARAITAPVGISSYARDNRFDLIVMATCASGLGRFFLGSTTEKVISYTNLPVLALPPKYCA